MLSLKTKFRNTPQKWTIWKHCQDMSVLKTRVEQVMPGAAKGFGITEEQLCIKTRCFVRCLNLQNPLKLHTRSVLDKMTHEPSP